MIRTYLKRIRELPPFNYNHMELEFANIKAFMPCHRRFNDYNNITRETIIGAIINNKVPDSYYTSSNQWTSIKQKIETFTDGLINTKNENTIRCIHMGGRKYNYDFQFIINDNIQLKIEFKYNVSKLQSAPQFVSPMNPSLYMSSSYEQFYYDNYLPKLALLGGLTIPSMDTYMNEIHFNKPPCMAGFQELYYKGCNRSCKYNGDPNNIKFYKYANELDNESRRLFIENNDLDIKLLTHYLKNTQKDKIYMLYDGKQFHKEIVPLEEYQLTSYEKVPSKYKYIATSATGKKINILLRWKNGNGIAYPSFQIS